MPKTETVPEANCTPTRATCSHGTAGIRKLYFPHSITALVCNCIIPCGARATTLLWFSCASTSGTAKAFRVDAITTDKPLVTEVYLCVAREDRQSDAGVTVGKPHGAAAQRMQSRNHSAANGAPAAVIVAIWCAVLFVLVTSMHGGSTSLLLRRWFHQQGGRGRREQGWRIAQPSEEGEPPRFHRFAKHKLPTRKGFLKGIGDALRPSSSGWGRDGRKLNRPCPTSADETHIVTAQHLLTRKA